MPLYNKPRIDSKRPTLPKIVILSGVRRQPNADEEPLYCFDRHGYRKVFNHGPRQVAPGWLLWAHEPHPTLSL
jgi:hypothetical protein